MSTSWVEYVHVDIYLSVRRMARAILCKRKCVQVEGTVRTFIRMEYDGRLVPVWPRKLSKLL